MGRGGVFSSGEPMTGAGRIPLTAARPAKPAPMTTTVGGFPLGMRLLVVLGLGWSRAAA